MRIKMIIAICISVLLFSCRKNKDDEYAYLDQWVGIYVGISYHWSTHPVDTIMVTNEQYKVVIVDVQKNESESSLDFTLTYNDGIIDNRDKIKFTTSGTHSSNWGGGSGYGSLDIDFKSDSLHYDYYQKCGIPCNSGIEFKIKRN